MEFGAFLDCRSFRRQTSPVPLQSRDPLGNQLQSHVKFGKEAGEGFSTPITTLVNMSAIPISLLLPWNSYPILILLLIRNTTRDPTYRFFNCDQLFLGDRKPVGYLDPPNHRLDLILDVESKISNS